MKENTDWKTAGLRDFLEMDSRIYPQLPDGYREGTHLALLFAALHSDLIRNKYANDCRLNEMNAFRFIRDHGDLPLTPETILAIYGAMLEEGTSAGWKISNVFLETSQGFYVTTPADQTRETMEALCHEFSCLNEPDEKQFDEIFKFILNFICIHPFQDGNGRMHVFLLQFLLQKTRLKCAVYLPLDILLNGVFAAKNSLQIRRASGVFVGMKPMEYEFYIPYMKETLAKSYLTMLEAIRKIR